MNPYFEEITEYLKIKTGLSIYPFDSSSDFEIITSTFSRIDSTWFQRRPIYSLRWMFDSY